MDIMDPSLTLLNTKISPFRFRHQMGFRDQLGYVLGQHDMSVRETRGCEEFVVAVGTVLDTDLYTKTSRGRRQLTL